MLVPTVVNVVLAFCPRMVIAPRHTTMMSASMTAYSTAVGPSSCVRKPTANFCKRANMTDPFRSRESNGSQGCLEKTLTCARALAAAQGSAFSLTRGKHPFKKMYADRGTTPFGSLAIRSRRNRTHGFASHPRGWFAFVVVHDHTRPADAGQLSWTNEHWEGAKNSRHGYTAARRQRGKSPRRCTSSNGKIGRVSAAVKLRQVFFWYANRRWPNGGGVRRSVR